MNAFVLILYAFLLAIGLLTIALTYKQWEKSGKPFYSPFFYFVLFSFIFGFLNYFGRFFTKLILAEQHLNNFTRNVVDLFLNGLAVPFCLIGLYFYIIFIRELLEQKRSRRLRTSLIIIGMLMMAIFTVDYIEYLNSAGGSIPDFITISVALINIIFCLISYAAILQILFYRKKIKVRANRKSLVSFAILVIALDSLYFIFLYKLLARDLLYYFVPIVFFLSPLIQLVYIKLSLDRFYMFHPLQFESLADSSDVYKKQNITEREKEIIELIRLGKSNREIHEMLFISLQTVKNYISTIYQKLNVRNRVELTNLINRLATDKDEHK